MSLSRDSFPVLPLAPERTPTSRRSRVLQAMVVMGMMAFLAALPFTLTVGDPSAVAPAHPAEAPDAPSPRRWSPSSASPAPNVFDVSQLPRVEEPVIEVPARRHRGDVRGPRPSPR